jgi:hypothetical protein
MGKALVCPLPSIAVDVDVLVQLWPEVVNVIPAYGQEPS